MTRRLSLLFTVTARIGHEALRHLGWYVLVVLLGLAIQQFGVYSASVSWFGGMSPRAFFRGIRPAMVTAFSTASSNATLPTSLRVAEEELHLPSHVSRFVLTVGSTANQNGTARSYCEEEQRGQAARGRPRLCCEFPGRDTSDPSARRGARGSGSRSG